MYTIIDMLDANIRRSFSERVRRKKRIVIALVFHLFFPFPICLCGARRQDSILDTIYSILKIMYNIIRIKIKRRE